MLHSLSFGIPKQYDWVHVLGQELLSRSSLSFIHLLYIHLSFLTLLVSWEASVIPESPEYFISTIFR